MIVGKHNSEVVTKCRCLGAGVVMLIALPLPAQIPLNGSSPGGTPRIQNTDMAVFEAGDPRKDLPCTVSPDKSFLGFDLRFHTGYDVSIPLRELAGNENLLTILFRVAPENQPEQPRYFVQRIRVPSIEEDAKGDAYLQGMFDVGEGNYKVDWLIRDRSERVCSFSWDVEASLPARDKTVSLMIQPNGVEATRFEEFHEEPPIERSASEPPLNVKVLMNFAPQKATAATLRPLDTTALVSILRTLSREPRIGTFSLVVFNLQEQKILFRQDGASKIDFRGLGKSLDALNLGTVDLKRLSQKHGETEFLAELIARELSNQKSDAIVFAGPKALIESNVPEENLRSLGDLDFPVFYMNYVFNPQATPWRDAIGNAVKFFKGTEFTISRPRDLWFAVTEMVSRIVKFRNGKKVAAVSSK